MVHDYFKELVDKKYVYMDLRELYGLLKTSVSRLDIVRVSVKESQGYVLAEEIRAKYDRPLFDISHFDGFAVRYDDLVNASKYTPVKLRIVEGIDSRSANEYELKSGEAVLVETGYPLPVNADVVIPVEEVVIYGNNIVVDKIYSRYTHVFKKGSDFRANDIVLKFSTRITPIVQKILIDMGYETIRVYRKPRIAIYSVGDELSNDVYKPETGKLPASTFWIDKYCFEYYGGEVIETGILPDDAGVIVKTVKEAINRADLVVTIGGVSVGPRDRVWIPLFREFKPDKWWRGVKTVPGRVTSGFVINSKLVINQPGLPQSSIVSLIFVLTPIIEYMQGLDLKLSFSCIDVYLAEDIVFNKFIDFYRVFYLNIVGDKAYPLKNPGTYYLNPLIQSNSFTLVDPGFERIREGSVVKACFYPPLFQPIRSEVVL